MKRIDFWAIVLLVLGCLGMLFLPHLVTQTSWLNCIDADYGNANEIGDMIGGISGPFVALISAGLIYLTLREQIAMNDEFKKRFDKEDKASSEEFIYREVKESLKIVRENISELSFLHTDGSIYKGISGIPRSKAMITTLIKTPNYLSTIGVMDMQKWERDFDNYLFGYMVILDKIYSYWNKALESIQDQNKLYILFVELEELRYHKIKLVPKNILDYLNLNNTEKGIPFLKNKIEQLVYFQEFKLLKVEEKIASKISINGKNKNGVDLKITYKDLPEIERIFNDKLQLFL